ncbi:hypothetical protein, partial [Salmonella enterica]|uniref:hypothetical protein n=1 Tax=Salmonella enterica TaxID=28901 RepID=UPI0019D5AA4F
AKTLEALAACDGRATLHQKQRDPVFSEVPWWRHRESKLGRSASAEGQRDDSYRTVQSRR